MSSRAASFRSRSKNDADRCVLQPPPRPRCHRRDSNRLASVPLPQPPGLPGLRPVESGAWIWDADSGGFSFRLLITRLRSSSFSRSQRRVCWSHCTATTVGSRHLGAMYLKILGQHDRGGVGQVLKEAFILP